MFELHSNFTFMGVKAVVDGMYPTERQLGVQFRRRYDGRDGSFDFEDDHRAPLWRQEDLNADCRLLLGIRAAQVKTVLRTPSQIFVQCAISNCENYGPVWQGFRASA